MPTTNVKLVIIGASGVGKTSLRTKYTSGRFSQNYRATIGADFITKTIPHHDHPDDSIQLQIWDTAGQERFSSLATAFFRGADAVILVYDLTDPESLHSLTKWWDEFRTRAPVEEGHEADFPVAIVGNKLDMIEGKDTGTWRIKHRRMGSGASTTGDKVVTEEEARAFLRDLIPLPEGSDDMDETSTERPDSDIYDGTANGVPNGIHSKSSSTQLQRNTSSSTTPSPIPGPSRYRPGSTPEGVDSRATSRSRYANGTVTTTMSIYHTAASSLTDSTPPTPSGRNKDKNALNGALFWDPEVEEAIASNSAEVVGEGEIVLDSGYRSVSTAVTPNGEPLSRTASKAGQLLEAPSASPGSSARRRLVSSNSGSSVQTITPSRVNSSSEVPKPNDSVNANQPPLKSRVSKPPPGPALFLGSAKTGEGISEVFEYIAERVTKKWEWEESRMYAHESSSLPLGNGDSRIILRELQNGPNKDGKNQWGCC